MQLHLEVLNNLTQQPTHLKQSRPTDQQLLELNQRVMQIAKFHINTLLTTLVRAQKKMEL